MVLRIFLLEKGDMEGFSTQRSHSTSWERS